MPSAVVFSATSKGYVPAGLPLTWLPQLQITLAQRWNTVVKGHSGDWRLCKECCAEVEQCKYQIPASQSDSEGKILALATVYCSHILRIDGQTTALNLSGQEYQVTDLLVSFSHWANTLLPIQAITRISVDATFPSSRLASVRREDMQIVIAQAREIVSRLSK